MATYAKFQHVELYKIGHGKNRVPNAPKSSIAEIFNSELSHASPIKNGAPRPRNVRDTPTRPRDTHSRLFGQASSSPMAPMVNDTIRSHIQFEDSEITGGSSWQSFNKPSVNGSTTSTPSRGEMDLADHSLYSPPKRNPVTGDGVPLPPLRRRHPAAGLRGAHPDPLAPLPSHRYHTTHSPPEPAHYYVHSTTKPRPDIPHTPQTLIGLQSDDTDNNQPPIDPNSLSPQLVLDRNWPPFPVQHYLETKTDQHNIPYHPLPLHAFVGMTSALGDRAKPDYKDNPVPTLDSPVDPYLVAHTNPPPSLFKYERDGPIPDFTPLETPICPGPRTLTGFPSTFHKHVPGYLFKLNRHAEDFEPKTYYVDYIRRRQMEGNPITGNYKCINGEINTQTSLHSHKTTPIRIPPGGYSSGLW